MGLKTQTYQLIKACKIKPYVALCIFRIFPAGISSFSLHMYVLQYIEKEIIFSFGITGKSAGVAKTFQKPQGSLLKKTVNFR